MIRETPANDSPARDRVIEQASRSSSRASSRGFTLVELLVVIALIGILMSLLLPAAMSSRRQSHAAVCASNLRQLGTMVYLYADRNKDRIPGGTTALEPAPAWHTALNVYVWVGGQPSAMLGPFLAGGMVRPGEAKLFHCPGERKDDLSYDVNADRYRRLEPEAGTTIATSYAIRPQRVLWVHDTASHTVRYPAMPKLVKLRSLALLADTPQLRPANHGVGRGVYVNVLYADNSVRVVHEKFYDAPYQLYVRLAGPFPPGMYYPSVPEAYDPDQPDKPTIWHRLDRY